LKDPWEVDSSTAPVALDPWEAPAKDPWEAEPPPSEEIKYAPMSPDTPKFQSLPSETAPIPTTASIVPEKPAAPPPVELKAADQPHEIPEIPPPTRMQQLGAAATSGAKDVGRAYANLGAIPFKAASKIQEFVSTGMGDDEAATKNEAKINQYVKSQSAQFNLSPDEEETLKSSGLSAKALKLAIEFAGNAPLYMAPIGGTEALIGKLATRYGKSALGEALPIILKTAKSESIPQLKSVASNILGVGAVSGGEEAGREITAGENLDPWEIAKEVGKGAVLGFGGTPIGKSGLTRAATSAAGAGVATAATGGTLEQIALNAALMGAASKLHKPAEKDILKPEENKPIEMPELKDPWEAPTGETMALQPVPPEIMNRKLHLEKTLSDIKNPEDKKIVMDQLLDEHLGEFGVSKFPDADLTVKQLERSDIPFAYERDDGLNLGGANEALGHGGSDKAIKEIWGTFAQEVQKNGGIVFRGTGDELKILWPNKTAEEVAPIRQEIGKKVDALIEEKGYDKFSHPKLNGLPTGSFNLSYGIVDHVPGKYGEVDRTADALSELNKKDFLRAKSEKSGYTYNEETNKYEHGKLSSQTQPSVEPASPRAGSVPPEVSKREVAPTSERSPTIPGKPESAQPAPIQEIASIASAPLKSPLKKTSLENNYVGDLSKHTDNVYHETNIDNAIKFLPKSLHSEDVSRDEIYFSNNPDLALGQGDRKGILLGFKTEGLQGKIDTNKSAYKIMMKNGDAELIGKYNSQNQYKNNLTSILIKSGSKASPVARRRMPVILDGLEKDGWAKTILDNGDILYKKPETIPAQKSPVAPTVEPTAETPKPVAIESPITDIKAKLDEVAASEAAWGARAAGGIAYGQELPKLIPGSNLSKIVNEGLDLATAGEPAYSLKKLAVDITDSYAPYIDKLRRGKMTWEEIAQKSDELGFDAKMLLQRKQGQAYNPEQLWGAAVVNQASLQKFRSLQEQMSAKKQAGTFNDEDKATLAIGMREAAAVYGEFAGARAEAGRSLNILKKVRGLQSEQKIEELFDSLGGKEINDKIINKLLTEDLGKINDKDLGRLVDKLSKATTMDKISEAWTAMILSAPPTHVTNILSNSMTALYKPLVETPIAATMELPKALLGKERQVKFGQVRAELVGLIAGMPHALKNAVETFKSETPRSTTEKIELPRKGAIGGNLGKGIRIPFRALSAADEFFKQIIRSSTLHADAYKQVKSFDLDEIKKLVDNPTKQMLTHADKEAEYRTYTQPLGKAMNSIMALKTAWPGLQFIIPFVKTPTNIFKYVIERTPIGFVDKAIKISKGKITPDQISEELAKPIAGAALGIAAASLASSGLITGAGPKDANKRNALYETGWMPYSLKIGDTYYSYGRLDPLGSIIGLVADFTEIRKDKASEKINWDDVAQEVAYSVGRNATSKTFLQGFTNMVQAISDPKRYGENWIQSMAGSVVPNIIASEARAQDEKYRQVNDVREAIMSRIPKVSEMLMPKRDAFGRTIDRAGNFWTRFLSPIQYSAAKGDKVDEEIVRIDADLIPPTKRISVPKSMQKYEKAQGNKQIEKFYELQDKKYDDLIREAGEMARKVEVAFINSKVYDGLDDDVKKEEVEKLYRNVINSYRKREKYKYVLEKLEGEPSNEPE
jgi:GGDEF domain-containing protein